MIIPNIWENKKCSKPPNIIYILKEPPATPNRATPKNVCHSKHMRKSFKNQHNTQQIKRNTKNKIAKVSKIMKNHDLEWHELFGIKKNEKDCF